MNSYKRKHKSDDKAQGIVEFALVLPILLLVMFGIIEFGRLLFTYSAVFTSSRDAARYGSAAGNIGGYLAHYQDCDGMRASAKRFGTLVGIEDSNISIDYYRTEDHDDDDSTPDIVLDIGDCPIGGLGPDYVGLGDRVSVNVVAQFEPILPLVNVPSFPISNRTLRTIVTDLAIEGTPPPPPPEVPAVYIYPETESGDEDSLGDITVWFIMNIPIGRDVTVEYSLGGTATLGDDYTIDRSSPVVIRAGTSRTSLNISVIPDDIDEYDEEVILTITSVTNASLGTPYIHTTTILDDDDPPYVSFSESTSSGAEVEGVVSEIHVWAELSNVSGKPITVPLSVSGTANQEDPEIDFNIVSESIFFPPGSQTSFVNVQVFDDDIAEDDETVILTMDAPAGNPPTYWLGAITGHTATIVDNDGPVYVSFETEEQVVQGTQRDIFDKDISIPIVSSPRSSKELVVWFTVESSSGIDDSNGYSITPSPVIIPALDTSLDLLLNIDGALNLRQDEAITVTIQTAANEDGSAKPEVYLVDPIVHTVLITPRPVVWFEETSQSVVEASGVALVEVSMWPAQEADVSVPFSLGGTAKEGPDYHVNQPLIIPVGATSATITVFINEERVDEDNETVILTLGDPSIGIRGTPYEHTVTIIDDDQAPTVSFTEAGQKVHVNSGSATIWAQLSAPSSREITVPFYLSGSASEGLDYSVLSPSEPELVFHAGVTTTLITLNIYDNPILDGNKEIVVSLGTPTNATLATPMVHTVTIYNDETACNIYDQNELVLSPALGLLAWDLANLTSNQLILTNLSLTWPAPPMLDYIDLNGQPIWDGDLPPPQATVSDWIPGSSRELLPFPGNSTIILGLNDVLPLGEYTLSLVFYNVDLDIPCAPVYAVRELIVAPLP